MARFQPTRPLRDATADADAMRRQDEFQPTRPLRDATIVVLAGNWLGIFQPTRPLRDATWDWCNGRQQAGYFNPRVPCGTRHIGVTTTQQMITISTHASLAGRDHRRVRRIRHRVYFNPRVPCGTRRDRALLRDARRQFQPTRPLRDATRSCARRNRAIRFQPTRPLRDATSERDARHRRRAISTHASLAGRDALGRMYAPPPSDFNPRVPCGTRRAAFLLSRRAAAISTHASLAGRDFA